MEIVDKKKDYKEKLIVSGVFIAIFLPVRLVFYTYVSQWWLGSLGLISALAFIVTYLSHKDKLGKFGRMWKKQIVKLARGKLGVISMSLAITMIVFYSITVYGFNAGQDHEAYPGIVAFLQEEDMMIINNEQIERTGLEQIYDNFNLKNVAETLTDFSKLSPQEMFSLFTLMLAVVDRMAGGWFQHFYIVFFVEEIERLGLTIYFRYIYKN